jgi:hypothetical protein
MTTQTTIALKNSGATGNTPPLEDMAYGELAINYADGKLFYKTSTNILGSYSIVVSGVNKDIIFNDNGVYGTSSGLTFDKSTSNLAVSNIVTTSNINLNNISLNGVGVYITSNTNQVVVDTFPISTYRTAKYTMQISYDGEFHSEEITIIHNNVSPRIVEYGVIYSNLSLGSFDVSIVDSVLQLTFIPVNANTTLKYNRTLISV